MKPRHRDPIDAILTPPLSPRHREILKLRDGLNRDARLHSLAEVAPIFDLLPEQVRCIETEAIEDLRSRGPDAPTQPPVA